MIAGLGARSDAEQALRKGGASAKMTGRPALTASCIVPLLQVLEGPGAGTLIALDADCVTLGRDSECGVVLPVTNVSRNHARILRIEGKHFIEDLDSRNGTFINGERIAGRVALKNNDRVRICGFVAVFFERAVRPGEGDENDEAADAEPTTAGGFATPRSLLERLQDRADSAAWQHLVSVYGPWLRSWLGRENLQTADAEDVLQDVLVAVSQEAPRFVHNGRPGAFRTWLKAILDNRVRLFRRSRRGGGGAARPLGDWVEELADPDSTQSRQWDEEHDRHLLRRALASLEAECNETTCAVFRMLALEGRSHAETARALGITPNAVSVAKARGFAKVREELGGLLDL
jgi:RNA polymerase sigma-70 factor (ECF subfamily)